MATFKSCQSCGFDIANGFRFCGNCGKPVNDYAGIPGLEIAAERRNLILMFCDLVGSSALAERLDPEDMLQVLDRMGRLPQHIPVGLHALQLGRGLRLLGVEGEVLAQFVVDTTGRAEGGSFKVLKTSQ